MDQDISSFHSLTVSKADKLFYQSLTAEIVQQFFFRLILAEFFPVIVGILESELDSQSATDNRRKVRSDSRSILRYEYIRHDTATAIYGTSQTGIIAFFFILLDTVA